MGSTIARQVWYLHIPTRRQRHILYILLLTPGGLDISPPPSHWRTAPPPPPLPQSPAPPCHYVLCPHRSPTTLGVYIWGEGGLGQQGVGFQQDCDVMSFSQISWPWPGDLFLSGPSPVVTRPVARPDPRPSIFLSLSRSFSLTCRQTGDLGTKQLLQNHV